jgi:hypothetical protein
VSFVRLGRLVSLVAGVGSLLTGCFYIDPINRRAEIQSVDRQCDTSDADHPCDSNFVDLHRGDSVKLKAMYSDVDGRTDLCTLQWRVAACAGDAKACDSDLLDQRDGAISEFDVPKVLKETGGPVESIRVELALYDDRGALTPYTKVLTVNDGPTLGVRRSARSYAIGAPIELFATYGDPDDQPSDVAVAFTVFTPDARPAYALTDLDVAEDPSDPTHLTVGKTLVPQELGDWDVRVKATDPHSNVTEKHFLFTVVPDQPPCLAQWAPIAPPDGATLPVTAPTLFEVPLVDDDLDPYPQVPDQPLLGTTTFAWSILPPGAPARQPLIGATGNSVDFDPGAFTPGQIVELRVEIFDRNHGAIACADGDPVCFASAACNQRQTWRVEIR